LRYRKRDKRLAKPYIVRQHGATVTCQRALDSRHRRHLVRAQRYVSQPDFAVSLVSQECARNVVHDFAP
jgi:hypothetical protein